MKSTNPFSDYLINHVVFVLDASISMRPHVQALIKATDAQIKHLSQETGEDRLKQETRVAVYTFDDKAQCIVPERDVHRLPSISEVYRIGGSTALVDATTLALDDAALVCQKYGNHAFLIFVLTDGEENVSSPANVAAFPDRMRNLPDNVTVACLVPSAASNRAAYYARRDSVAEAARWGFLRDNIAEWDIRDVETASRTMATATTSYLQARATGLRATSNLFSMDATKVNDATVKQNLTRLSPDDYKLVPVTAPKGEQAKGKHGMWEIKEFAEHSGWSYAAGETGYYQFVYIMGVKPSEKVTPGKKIIIVEKSTGIAYSGPEARTLLGLSHDKTDRIRKQHNEKYDVYISSDSVNRHLPTGTNLLLFKPVPLNQKK